MYTNSINRYYQVLLVDGHKDHGLIVISHVPNRGGGDYCLCILSTNDEITKVKPLKFKTRIVVQEQCMDWREKRQPVHQSSESNLIAV